MTTCPRCSDCIGMTHHWLPNASEAFPAWYDCKHCDQKGYDCTCDGAGCDECNNEGVRPAHFLFCPACGNYDMDTAYCLTCESVRRGKRMKELSE
jgi:hypothetical protein